MWDREITALFDGAGDFIRRPLQCGALTLMTYAIDGLTSGGGHFGLCIQAHFSAAARGDHAGII